MKKFFSFFILYILVNLAANAQKDPLFSNYMFTRSIANPGFVGAEKTIDAVFSNRTMFAGFGDGKPVTSVFGVNAPVDLFGARSGVGILVMSDEIGFYSNVNVDASFAYHHTLQNGTLGGGLTIGFKNYALETGSWYIPSDGEYFGTVEGDDLIPNTGEFNEIIFGLGAGVYYETPEYYLGLSVSNINQGNVIYTKPDETETIIDYYNAHFYLTGAYNIELPDPLFDLRPSILLRNDLAAFSMDLIG